MNRGGREGGRGEGVGAARAPALLQALRFSRDPAGFLGAHRARRGPSFRIDVWPVGELLVVSDPRSLSALFAADPAVLRAGAATEHVLPVLAGSILCADGDEHALRRRLLLPAFRKSRLAGHAGLIERETIRLLDSLPRGRPVAMLPRMLGLSFRVIAQVVLGSEDDRAIEELRRRAVRYVAGPAVLAAWPGPLQRPFARRLAGRRAELDAILRSVITRPRGRCGDVLSLLVGSGVDEPSLLAELRGLLLVGHETTACALAWGTELLARNPASADRLAEDDAYAEAFAEETLRLRPAVVDAVRLAASPTAIGPLRIPQGTVLMAAPLLVHADPALHPEPHRFRPERFLGARPATGTYIPFGGGARRCLGAQLAMLELRVVLQTLARHVRLSPARARAERARLRATALAPDRGAEVVLSDL